ncbi:copper chaperone PCu(A)C [Mariniluteicoccus flavus]
MTKTTPTLLSAPRLLLALGLAALPLAACSNSTSAAPGATASASAPAQAAIIVEKPWVRSTEGSKDTSMTAAFMNLTNPGDKDISVTRAESAVAGRVEVHEMVTVDGKMVMREAKNGVVVKAGKHEHLAPGGPHIMLMQLKQPLKVGEEVTVTVHFSDGSQQVLKAPVKKFTEEQDTYHTHEASTPTPQSSSPQPSTSSQPSTSLQPSATPHDDHGPSATPHKH